MSLLPLLSRPRYPSPQNYQSVAHPECQNDIRCGKIYLVQFLRLPVHAWIQHRQHQKSQANVSRQQSQYPPTFRRSYSVQKTKWKQAHWQVKPAKFFSRHYKIQADLFENESNIGSRIHFLVLSASEDVEETFHRTGITPVYRRICHRSNRQVKIKRQPQQKQTTAN